MPESVSTLPLCPPIVSHLLEQAESLAVAERMSEARAAFLAAISADTGQTARNACGCFLSRIDCHEEALEQFSHVLAAAQSSGNRLLRAAACNNLAAVYREMGRFDVAARWQQLSIAAEAEVDNFTNGAARQASDLANLANDAIAAGNYGFAEGLLLRSLLLEIERGSLEGQAADWGSLGVVAILRGESLTAMVCLGHAYRMHRRLSDARSAGCDLMNLAELCSRMGRWRTAVRLLKHALRCFERAQATKLASRARNFLQEASAVVAVAKRDPLLN